MASYIEPIVNWKIQHDQVVMMHLAGYDRNTIAAECGYTPVRVSQILADPQAERIIARAQKAFRAKLIDSIGDRMLELADLSSLRLKETINEEFETGTRAKHHQDKMSLEVLKGTGFLSRDVDSNREQSARFSPQLVDRLVTALDKSNEVAEILGAPISPHEEVPSSSDNVSNEGGDPTL